MQFSNVNMLGNNMFNLDTYGMT
ncbi:hypothetical protein F383_15458 [Gossypium arboreum]|uniref:Uncharacterized protein n=1 Tax=Gossypium arboreum TaxID=29729 RepID=A0A0B0NER2_GOSAR|nr:hypothetical protein F383_15458 [Gossypium arboreum]